MNRSRRIYWLPAVTVLLPCLFLAVLAGEWARLNREVDESRSEGGAEAAAAALRSDLLAEAGLVANQWAGSASEPLAPMGLFPSTTTDAHRLRGQVWLFDASGVPLTPDGEDLNRQAADAHRIAVADPAWERPLAGIRELGASGRTREATAALERLLEQSPAGTVRAAVLLALGRLAASAGRLHEARSHALRLLACCPATRDEYGVAFVLYAARQYIAAGGQADIALLAQPLARAIERGLLTDENDILELQRIGEAAAHAGATPSFASLVADAIRVRSLARERMAESRVVSRWISRQDLEAVVSDRPLVTLPNGEDGPLVFLIRIRQDRLVALSVARTQLQGWTDTWARHRGLDLSLDRSPVVRGSTRALSDADGTARVFTPALFPEQPSLRLLVRQPASDPAGGRRERLFMAAAAGVLALTLAIGYFSVRDVARELRTASLRASFVTGVTHELKTPLASIRLLAETLRQGRAKPDVIPELLDTVLEEAERLSRLVDNVLESSQIESGTRVYAPQIVAIQTVLRSALERFHYVLSSEGFTVIEQMDTAPLPVRVDPEGLERAVLNLLGNAVKYSDRNRRIEVNVAQQDAGARISIVDEGLGISPADQGRIFERFYRAPNTAAHTTGAGLGLALVRHVVEGHGGRVSVASELGRGSAFSIWLPLAEGRDRQLTVGLVHESRHG